MKRILGLDLGTNSIGWALIEIDHKNGIVRIIGLGSRILPMTADEIGEFGNGAQIESAAAKRTAKRGPRRLNERFILRRDRLHLVLNLLQALPKHYKLDIDFSNGKGEKSGQFKANKEPKIAYSQTNNQVKSQFLFSDSYLEMLDELGIENKKRTKIPYDWTLYYLRQKALSKEISLEELAWVLLSYNQKRGYEKLEVESSTAKDTEIIEELDLRVKSVQKKVDKFGNVYFKVDLDGGKNISYNEYTSKQLTFENDIKEVKITSNIDDKGNIDHSKTFFTVIDIYPLTITQVKHESENNKHLYHLMYDNGWEQSKRKDKPTLQFESALNKPYDYVVETTYDKFGEIKLQSGIERKLREPDFSDNSNDWTLLKKKTEKEALAFNLTKFDEPKKFISPKIYSILTQDAISGNRTKIIGGMFQTVDRSFYREELKQIITTQRKFHQNLNDREIFEKCVKLLYPNNKSHAQTLLTNKDAIQHLLIEDILLYQRPLKSKKSEIADCKFEIKYTKDALDNKGNTIEILNKATGEITLKKEFIRHKVVPISHPYYQEFRIWDKLHNLKIFQLEQNNNGDVETNVDVTKQILTEEVFKNIFELLNNQKTLTSSGFMKFLTPVFKTKKWNVKDFIWNFPEDDEIKGNTTRVDFAIRFKRCGFTDYTNFLTQEKERILWHYLYSVSYKERVENNFKSIRSFFQNTFFMNFDIDNDIIENLIQDFANFPKFEAKYGAYSEKSLKKLLPQMKLISDKVYAWEEEKYFIKFNQSLIIRKQEILNKLQQIDFSTEITDYTKVINNDAAVPFPKGLFNVFKDFENLEDFTKLNLTKASYLVYGRHSELEHAKYWHSPEQIRQELHQELKQHSLNNPIAEKILLEMMQVVADIWDYHGQGKENFFTNIHIEVARELKKSAKEKKKQFNKNRINKLQNDRLRQVLEEFLSVDYYKAKPKNTDHFERLKILEDGASHTKNTNKDFFNNKSYSKKDIDDILKKSKITKVDFEKYKLWIEQGYKSPYTNKIIKLTDLFDGNKYNVDHILPRASVTNDSLNNKVVCETEINIAKSNRTARDFILNPNQKSIYCSAHDSFIELVDDNSFTNIIKSQFSGSKRTILLSKDVPKEFTSSQLNNTRHIARKAMELLSHIVREEGEVEYLSKNVLPITGEITSKLRRAWKLDQVWKQLVAPRFIRMNELTDSNLFGSWKIDKNGVRYFDCAIDDLIREKNPNFDIKRIDHRHHALDALVVALCTREHVNYFNNINADAKSNIYGKQKQIEKYRETLKRKIQFSKPNKETPKNKDWFYLLPGERRIENKENQSSRESVLSVNYSFKDVQYGREISHFSKMIFDVLNGTTTSFKTNKYPIRKTSNKYWSYKTESGKLNLSNGIPKKTLIKQLTDENRKRNIAIRKGMHDEIPYGERYYDFELKELGSAIKSEKDFDNIYDEGLRVRLVDLFHNSNEDIKELFSNIKKENNNSFPEKTFFKSKNKIKLSISRKSIVGLNKKQIDKIVNPEIYHDILEHLKKFETIDEAMSAYGIEEFNKTRKIPVKKVTLGERGDGRYVLGKSDLKKSTRKMVKGVNYSLFIDRDEKIINTISLKTLIDEKDEVNNVESETGFHLLANDLVSIQKEESNADFSNLNNIYLLVNSTGEIANFSPVNIANTIWDYGFPDAKKEEKEYNSLLFEKGNFNSDKNKPLKNEIGLGSKQNKHTREFIYNLEERINAFKGETIRDFCIKLKIDRLGNISKA